MFELPLTLIFEELLKLSDAPSIKSWSFKHLQYLSYLFLFFQKFSGRELGGDFIYFL